jgi:hypothetical protein
MFVLLTGKDMQHREWGDHRAMPSHSMSAS